jgi:hypothetical protein
MESSETTRQPRGSSSGAAVEEASAITTSHLAAPMMYSWRSVVVRREDAGEGVASGL